MRSAWVLVASVAVLATGCVGAPDAPVAIESEPFALDATGAGAPPAVAAFPGDVHVDSTLWANGTYRVEEQGDWVGLARDLAGQPQAGLRWLDLSALVPLGVPARVVAEVDADVTRGDVDLWIDAPEEAWWAGDRDTPLGGWSRVEVTLLRTTSDPVRVGLYYDEAEPAAEFAYTLFAEVHADSDLLRPGVAAALEVPSEGARWTVEAETLREDAALLVFDPDDAFVGRFALADGATEIALDEAPAGEYVVVLSEGAARARITVEGIAATLRPVGWEYVEKEGTTAADGKMRWTFSTDRVPIQAGIFFRSGAAANDVDVRLASPDRELVAERWTGGPWLNVDPVFGSFFGWMTDVAAEGLVAGAYEASAEFGANAGDASAVGGFVHYVR